MSWLAILFVIETGLMPMNTWIQYPQQEGTVISETYYTHFETEVTAFDHVFVGGDVTTYMIPGQYGFEVTGTTYTFDAGLKCEPLTIGFRHVCGPHPVNAYPQFGTNPSFDGAFEGAYEQVYVRLEAEIE